MARIEELIGQMTLEEKVAMCAGSDVWHSTGVERLGIPRIKMTDGPNGARGDAVSGATAACFPVGSALAATWNVDLIERVGRAIGEEAKTKDAQVLLGPTINIHRAPQGGRHFECYSEDPYLSGRIAVAFVSGVQSQAVATSIKHFVCNDTEFERQSISSEVSERALREIYLPPFEAAVVEADAWSVMSAYNRVNGTFASSHHRLLTEILKNEWGFSGYVVSDWGASLETVENANAGLDLEMPGPARTMGEKLLAAVRRGDVSEEVIEDKVRRLLRVALRTGRLDAPDEAEERSVDLPEHRSLARRAAGESMVLIKNQGVLPLDPKVLRRVAVIGPNAEAGRIQGGGSSIVKPHYQVHPLAAIREALGAGVEVLHEPGCNIERYLPGIDPDQLRPANGEDQPGLLLEFWNGSKIDGDPVRSRVVRHSEAFFMGRFAEEVDPARFCARYSGTFEPRESGLHTFGLQSAGLSRLFLDEELLVDNWSSQDPGDGFFGRSSSERRGEVSLEAGEPYLIRVEYQRDPQHALGGLQFGVRPPQPGGGMERAIAAATEADAAIVVVGTTAEWETEGHDRSSISLPGDQDELVRKVIAANPTTAVVLNCGSPVALDWLEEAPALLQVWFAGQELGHALTDVLFGELSPSGRLPTSWPVRLEDTPAFSHYPGENGRLDYAEDIFVGYRWYDAHEIEPRIPFGHGLGYTRFEYGEISVDERARVGEPVELSLPITNVGDRFGQEVVQLYVRDPECSLPRPEKELKGFAKLGLEPGETESVRFSLDTRALSFWNPVAAAWVAEPGEFELLVGASSRDIRARARFVLEA